MIYDGNNRIVEYHTSVLFSMLFYPPFMFIYEFFSAKIVAILILEVVL